jgi:putative membrane protein
MTRGKAQRYLVTLAALTASSDAAAHAVAHANETSWTLDPWVVAPLLVSAAWFAAGARQLAYRSRLGAGHRTQFLWFVLGWLVLAVALVSPLHKAGERSFAAHMLEHELLMLVAAPLLVLGRPVGVALWALPHRSRLALRNWSRSGAFHYCWRTVSSPASATTLQLVALWGWHAPAAFDLALQSDGWHIAQHVSFLVTALLFWHALLRHPRTAVAVSCLFVTALLSGALGGLMAVSASPWYARYAALGMTPYGLTAAEDQQLAGLLMWIPGGALHAVIALVLLQRLLRDGSVAQAWRST